MESIEAKEGRSHSIKVSPSLVVPILPFAGFTLDKVAFEMMIYR